MADRVARVRLEAVTSTYRREMEQASASTEKLLGSTNRLDAIGGKMQRVGGAMTVGLTLPIAAAGGAAVKMATDFETSFASLVGLAGVPQAEVEGLKQSVLDLAGETGRAPQELAEALYFAASAGLDAAGAMDAVSVAAKGAAAGLGNTTDIVGLVASAVASYGEANITAAEAVDILTATIREGRADPDELAGTLGRILPIASQLGVEFDDVGGAVAYLSNVFGDTNRTVTALQGFLVKLVSPSQQGRDALEEMGTSVEELQEAIREDGLLGALDLLREQGFAGNQQALRALFDDIEGFQAALALLNDESGSLNEVMAALDDSAGSAEDAFANMAETVGFKNTQAFAQLQAALIQVGDILVPLIADVAEFAGKLLVAFNSLPGPAQTAVVAFAGVLAAVGPLASIGGKIASNWHTMGRAFDRAATGAFDMAGNMGKLKVALGALGIAAIAYEFHQWADSLSALNVQADELERMGRGGQADALKEMLESAIVQSAGHAERSLELVVDKMEALAQESPAAAEALLSIARSADGDLASAMEQAGVSVDDLAGAMDRGLEATSRSAEATKRNAEILEELPAAADPATEAVDLHAAAAEKAAEAEKVFEESIKDVTNALRSQFDPFFAATDAMLANEDAQRAVEEAHWDVTKASDDLAAAIAREGEESWAAKDAAYRLEQAQRNLVSAEREAGRSALDVATAMTELKTRVEEGDVALQEGADMLDQWVQQGIITKGQAEQLKLEMFYASLAAQDLGKQKPTPVVDLDDSLFWSKWQQVYAALGQDKASMPQIGPDGRFQTLRMGGWVDGAVGQAVPIVAHGREFVINADAAAQLGPEALHALNRGEMLPATYAAPVASSGGGGVSIDYDRLAGAVARLGGPQVVVNRGDQIDENTVASLLARKLAR